MKKYGLIGHPLGHSFSQTYFNTKFQQEHLDCHYENYDLDAPEKITELLSKNPDIIGLNVTSPYKEKILEYIDYYDSIVTEIKSANTLLRLPDGKMFGYNTDVVGFSTLLHKAMEKSLKPYAALILGTGGASKAVQYVLRQENIPFHVVSRHPEKGDFTYESLSPETIQCHPLLVNATPLGTHPHTEEAPDIPYSAITADHLLIDLIYNPEETLFLRRGRQQGARTANGLLMLHSQAQASWQLWNHPK